MKLKMYFALLALGSISLQSCGDDDNHKNPDLPAALQQAFSEKYPAATRIEWEVKGSYYEAEFTQNNAQTSAWFTPEGEWQMTETDLRYDALPAKVKTDFENSKYAQWRVDDVDQLDRKGSEVIYILDIESGKQEMDLYYSKDGILIKAVDDTDSDDIHTPPAAPTTPAAIENFIKENYPDARIIETEVENGITEVDIIHNQIGKDVKFNSTNEWISTSSDVLVQRLPALVTDAIKAGYGTYAIDDVDYVETPTGNFYLIELEKKGENDTKVKVKENGEFI